MPNQLMCVCTMWQIEEGSTERDGQFIPHFVSTKRCCQHLASARRTDVLHLKKNAPKRDRKRVSVDCCYGLHFIWGTLQMLRPLLVDFGCLTPGYTTQNCHIAALLKQIIVQKELYFFSLGAFLEAQRVVAACSSVYQEFLLRYLVLTASLCVSRVLTQFLIRRIYHQPKLNFVLKTKIRGTRDKNQNSCWSKVALCQTNVWAIFLAFKQYSIHLFIQNSIQQSKITTNIIRWRFH